MSEGELTEYIDCFLRRLKKNETLTTKHWYIYFWLLVTEKLRYLDVNALLEN